MVKCLLGIRTEGYKSGVDGARVRMKLMFGVRSGKKGSLAENRMKTIKGIRNGKSGEISARNKFGHSSGIKFLVQTSLY